MKLIYWNYDNINIENERFYIDGCTEAEIVLQPKNKMCFKIKYNIF